MSEVASQWLPLILLALGTMWVIGIEGIRGRSQSHPYLIFWLHLTAPVVCILLELVALSLILWR